MMLHVYYLTPRQWLCVLLCSIATVLLAAVPIESSGSSKIVDLSQEWALGTLYNQNKAYCTLQSYLNPVNTIGYVVIQNGEILAEGYTEGYERNGTYDAWSVTKSWSSVIIGKMVEQDLLDTAETLNDIFDQEADWENVKQAESKKTITVEELLTFTGGLEEIDCGLTTNLIIGFDWDIGIWPQRSFEQVMNAVTYKSEIRGTFKYLARIHIFSRIIERRTGLTPREFVIENQIFEKMGIKESEYNWIATDGIEGTAYGLQMNPRQIAKLGQLYLQGGLVKEGEQLIPSEWVEMSTTNFLDEPSRGVVPDLPGYGYQWYIAADETKNTNINGRLENAVGAAGAEGQRLLYLPASNTVIAIMCTGANGPVSSQLLLDNILDQLDDLHVEQTECDKSFNWFRYGVKNAIPLASRAVQIIPNFVSTRLMCAADIFHL